MVVKYFIDNINWNQKNIMNIFENLYDYDKINKYYRNNFYKIKI